MQTAEIQVACLRFDHIPLAVGALLRGCQVHPVTAYAIGIVASNGPIYCAGNYESVRNPNPLDIRIHGVSKSFLTSRSYRKPILAGICIQNRQRRSYAHYSMPNPSCHPLLMLRMPGWRKETSISLLSRHQWLCRTRSPGLPIRRQLSLLLHRPPVILLP